ncbi:transposase [Sphingomonas sp. PsM26]|nr:transposase [Sphingomonas sp. PsM26]
MDDYVGPDNPVRFIEAFVDGLELGAAGFVCVQPKATGRPGYDPADLLKLYIYGYLKRVRSSRHLETETHRNIEVIWLLWHLKPDFKTIADFRHDNRAAFKTVFREFVVLCRQLDLFGRELVAVDGTRIKAVNNKTRNFTQASLARFIQDADEKLAGYMKRLDEGDADEDRTLPPVPAAVRAAVKANWPTRSPPSRASAFVTRRCSPNWIAPAPTESRLPIQMPARWRP